MTDRERSKLIAKIARVLVDDWFKTDDRDSVFDLLIGDNKPLNQLSDEALLDYEKD